jgi:hypothetical protein
MKQKLREVMLIVVFWLVILYSLVGCYQHFRYVHIAAIFRTEIKLVVELCVSLEVNCLNFEVLPVVKILIVVFRVVMPCSLVVGYQYFREMYHLCFQPLCLWLNRNNSILEYWGPRKRHPELCKFAKVALKIPSRQITVERLFSDMGFILSALSFSIKEDM